LTGLRDEATLAVLIIVTAVVYGVLILALFGKGWLRTLLRAK
jgi:putative peptidoglycan lipid II flippase